MDGGMTKMDALFEGARLLVDLWEELPMTAPEIEDAIRGLKEIVDDIEEEGDDE